MRTFFQYYIIIYSSRSFAWAGGFLFMKNMNSSIIFDHFSKNDEILILDTVWYSIRFLRRCLIFKLRWLRWLFCVLYLGNGGVFDVLIWDKWFVVLVCLVHLIFDNWILMVWLDWVGYTYINNACGRRYNDQKIKWEFIKWKESIYD